MRFLTIILFIVRERHAPSEVGKVIALSGDAAILSNTAIGFFYMLTAFTHFAWILIGIHVSSSLSLTSYEMAFFLS